MLSEDYINGLLGDYVGGSSGGDFSMPDNIIEKMSEYGKEMSRILLFHIRNDTPSGTREGLRYFEEENIIVCKPELKKNKCYVKIQFNKDSLVRDSLVPDEYDPIEDIIRLFTTGYKAGGAVKGVWQGHGDEEIWSLRTRKPNNFIVRAAKEFAELHQELIVTVDKAYI